MSRFAARAVEAMLRRNNGTVGGLPRIYNVDRAAYMLGYTEINTQATSTFSRIKTHKGWFEGTSNIQDGDLIQDRVDGKYYLVMSLKDEFTGERVAYKDGTLYYANTTCTIQRGGAGTKDAFGFEASNTFSTVATGVYLMAQSVTLDVVEQKDQDLAKEKIKVAVQAKFGVQENDRLVTALGDTYKVVSVDKTQINGLWMLFVDKDVR